MFASWRDHLSFLHYCKANDLHDPRYDQETDHHSRHSKKNSLVKQARKTILNPLNLLNLDDGSKKKKKNNRKGAGGGGGGAESRSMNRDDPASKASRPAGATRTNSMRMSRAPSKQSMSMESAESGEYSDDDTADYDFDDDPDSGTDEEESVRGSFR